MATVSRWPIPRRRVWPLIALVVVLLAAGAGAYRWRTDSRPGARITYAGSWLIRPGMTEQEVQELLGGPPRSFFLGSDLWRGDPTGNRYYRYWYNDAGRMEVTFDRTGHVLEVSFQANSESLPSRVRRFVEDFLWR